MDKTPEKRGYTRFSFEKKIYINFEDNPADTLEGELIDISFGGLNFFIKGNIDEKTIRQATIKFDVPFLFNQHLHGSGKVVYTLPFELDNQEGFRVGIEFTQADKDVLLDFISQLSAIMQNQLRKKEGHGHTRFPPSPF